MDEEQFQAITDELSKQAFAISLQNIETGRQIYGDFSGTVINMTQMKHLMRLIAHANNLSFEQMVFLAKRVNDYIQEQVSSIKSAPSSN